MTRLAAVLGLTRPGLIALVGGGGKTTLLWALAGELAAAGQDVIATTTTHIHPPLAGQAAGLWLCGADTPSPDELAARLAGGGPLCLAAGRTSVGKLRGLAAGQMAGLLARPGLWVVCEADGAAGRPLKAWAAHEPALTGREAMLIVVAGAAGLGRPLTVETAHRPELLAAALGLDIGQTPEPEALAAHLAGPAGPLRAAPAAARRALVLGQADLTAPALRQRFLAAAAATGAFERVLWGSPLAGRLEPWRG
ncbi:MAG: selenium cofactor biosynthesis protein YqeC [Thermodesulfobacteriota bacterium]